MSTYLGHGGPPRQLFTRMMFVPDVAAVAFLWSAELIVWLVVVGVNEQNWNKQVKAPLLFQLIKELV